MENWGLTVSSRRPIFGPQNHVPIPITIGRKQKPLSVQRSAGELDARSLLGDDCARRSDGGLAYPAQRSECDARASEPPLGRWRVQRAGRRHRELIKRRYTEKHPLA